MVYIILDYYIHQALSLRVCFTLNEHQHSGCTEWPWRRGNCLYVKHFAAVYDHICCSAVRRVNGIRNTVSKCFKLDECQREHACPFVNFKQKNK